MSAFNGQAVPNLERLNWYEDIAAQWVSAADALFSRQRNPESALGRAMQTIWDHKNAAFAKRKAMYDILRHAERDFSQNIQESSAVMALNDTMALLQAQRDYGQLWRRSGTLRDRLMRIKEDAVDAKNVPEKGWQAFGCISYILKNNLILDDASRYEHVDQAIVMSQSAANTYQMPTVALGLLDIAYGVNEPKQKGIIHNVLMNLADRLGTHGITELIWHEVINGGASYMRNQAFDNLARLGDQMTSNTHSWSAVDRAELQKRRAKFHVPVVA